MERLILQPYHDHGIEIDNRYKPRGEVAVRCESDGILFSSLCHIDTKHSLPPNYQEGRTIVQQQRDKQQLHSPSTQRPVFCWFLGSLLRFTVHNYTFLYRN